MRTDFSNNPLVQHCLDFSLQIIDYSELLEEKRKFVVAKQLIRCGTAIGAMTLEAQSAESRADFVHKLKIADKEAFETWYWLYLCTHAKTYPGHELDQKLLEIMRLLHAIIRKSKMSGKNDL